LGISLCALALALASLAAAAYAVLSRRKGGALHGWQHDQLLAEAELAPAHEHYKPPPDVL
jgi:hypothetical protein